MALNFQLLSVLYNIMANEFVPEDFKDRLRVAARSGRDKQTCLVSENSRCHLCYYSFVLNGQPNSLLFQAFECSALTEQVTNLLD